MDLDLAPTACLTFESQACQSLQWLPLAVRFKLDECGLKLSLQQWQGLPLAERQALLALPSGAGFASRCIAAGATQHVRPVAVSSFAEYVRWKRASVHC